MNEQKKLVPELRFTEFRGAEGWKQRQLAEITTAIFDGTHQTPTYTDKGVPFYSVENLVSRNANKFISRPDYEVATKKNKPEKGDVLITRIGKIGYSQVVTWSHDFSIYVTLAVIKKDGRFNSDFLNQFIQSAFYQKEILSKSLLNAVPCKINMDSLRATHVLLASPAEQQKIADCLSSLDELIAAQARKVEALKTHKKGLMQQIFPREGETQPRLRFPEFVGDWEIKTLKHACKMQAGKFISASEIKDKNSDGFFPCFGGNGLRGYTEIHTHEGTYPLIGRQGALCGNVKLAKNQFYATEHALVATPNAGVHTVWLYYLLDFMNLNQYATGQAQPGLSVDVLNTLPVFIPMQEKEQQRIADSLSSVDDLIDATTQELDTLKTHKKGLMQQLFPSLEMQE
jgi:type I restriction enzyme S subunit